MLNNYGENGSGFNSTHGQTTRPSEHQQQKSQNLGTTWGYNGELESMYYSGEHQPMFMGPFEGKQASYQYPAGTIHQPVPTQMVKCQEACCQHYQDHRFPLNPAPLRYQPSAPRYTDLTNPDSRQYFSDRRTLQPSISRKKGYPTENGYPISDRHFSGYMGRGQLHMDSRQQMQMMRAQYPMYPPYWSSTRAWSGPRMNCPPPPYHQSAQLQVGLKIPDGTHYMDPAAQKMNTQHRRSSTSGATEIIRPVPETKRPPLDPNLQSCYEFGYPTGFVPYSEVNKLQGTSMGPQGSNPTCKIQNDKQYHPHQMQYSMQATDRNIINCNNPINDLNYPMNFPLPTSENYLRSGINDAQQLTESRKIAAQYDSSLSKKRPELDLRQYLETWDDDEDESARLTDPLAMGNNGTPYIVLDCRSLEGDSTAKIPERLKTTTSSQSCNAKSKGNSPNSERKRTDDHNNRSDEHSNFQGPTSYNSSMPIILNDSEKGVNFWNGTNREGEGIIGKGGAFQPLDCSKRDGNIDPNSITKRDTHPHNDMHTHKVSSNNDSSNMSHLDALVSYYGDNRRTVDGYDFVEMTERLVNTGKPTSTSQQLTSDISRPCDPRLQQSQLGNNPSIYNKLAPRYPSNNYQSFKPPYPADSCYNYKHPMSSNKYYGYENMQITDPNSDYHKMLSDFDSSRLYGGKEVPKDPRRLYHPELDKQIETGYLDPLRKPQIVDCFQDKTLEFTAVDPEQFINPIIVKKPDLENRDKSDANKNSSIRERMDIINNEIQPQSEKTVFITSQNGPPEVFRVPYSPEKETMLKDNVVTLHSGDQTKNNTITVEVPYVQQYSTLVKLSEEIGRTEGNNDKPKSPDSSPKTMNDDFKKPTSFKLKRLPNSKEWTVEGRDCDEQNKMSTENELPVLSNPTTESVEETDILKQSVTVSNLNMPSLDDIRDGEEICETARGDCSQNKPIDQAGISNKTIPCDEINKMKNNTQTPQMAIVQPMKLNQLNDENSCEDLKNKMSCQSLIANSPNSSNMSNEKHNQINSETESISDNISKHENFRTHKKIQNSLSKLQSCLSSPNEDFLQSQEVNQGDPKETYSPFQVYSDCDMTAQIPDYFKLDDRSTACEKMLDPRIPSSPGVEEMFEDINNSNHNQVYQSKTFQDLTDPNNDNNHFQTFSSMFSEEIEKTGRPDGSILQMNNKKGPKNIFGDHDNQEFSNLKLDQDKEIIDENNLNQTKESPPIPPISLKLNETKKIWCIAKKDQDSLISISNDCSIELKCKSSLQNTYENKIRMQLEKNLNQTLNTTHNTTETVPIPIGMFSADIQSNDNVTESSNNFTPNSPKNCLNKTEIGNKCLSIIKYTPKLRILENIRPITVSKNTSEVLVFDEKGKHISKDCAISTVKMSESEYIANDVVSYLINESIAKSVAKKENNVSNVLIEESNKKHYNDCNPNRSSVVNMATVIKFDNSNSQSNGKNESSFQECYKPPVGEIRQEKEIIVHQMDANLQSEMSDFTISEQKKTMRSIFSPMSDGGFEDNSSLNNNNDDKSKEYIEPERSTEFECPDLSAINEVFDFSLKKISCNESLKENNSAILEFVKPSNNASDIPNTSKNVKVRDVELPSKSPSCEHEVKANIEIDYALELMGLSNTDARPDSTQINQDKLVAVITEGTNDETSNLEKTLNCSSSSKDDAHFTIKTSDSLENPNSPPKTQEDPSIEMEDLGEPTENAAPVKLKLENKPEKNEELLSYPKVELNTPKTAENMIIDSDVSKRSLNEESNTNFIKKIKTYSSISSDSSHLKPQTEFEDYEARLETSVIVRNKTCSTVVSNQLTDLFVSTKDKLTNQQNIEKINSPSTSKAVFIETAEQNDDSSHLKNPESSNVSNSDVGCKETEVEDSFVQLVKPDPIIDYSKEDKIHREDINEETTVEDVIKNNETTVIISEQSCKLDLFKTSEREKLKENEKLYYCVGELCFNQYNSIEFHWIIKNADVSYFHNFKKRKWLRYKKQFTDTTYLPNKTTCDISPKDCVNSISKSNTDHFYDNKFELNDDPEVSKQYFIDKPDEQPSIDGIDDICVDNHNIKKNESDPSQEVISTLNFETVEMNSDSCNVPESNSSTNNTIHINDEPNCALPKASTIFCIRRDSLKIHEPEAVLKEMFSPESEIEDAENNKFNECVNINCQDQNSIKANTTMSSSTPNFVFPTKNEERDTSQHVSSSDSVGNATCPDETVNVASPHDTKTINNDSVENNQENRVTIQQKNENNETEINLSLLSNDIISKSQTSDKITVVQSSQLQTNQDVKSTVNEVHDMCNEQERKSMNEISTHTNLCLTGNICVEKVPESYEKRERLSRNNKTVSQHTSEEINSAQLYDKSELDNDHLDTPGVLHSDNQNCTINSDKNKLDDIDESAIKEKRFKVLKSPLVVADEEIVTSSASPTTSKNNDIVTPPEPGIPNTDCLVQSECIVIETGPRGELPEDSANSRALVQSCNVHDNAALPLVHHKFEDNIMSNEQCKYNLDYMEESKKNLCSKIEKENAININSVEDSLRNNQHIGKETFPLQCLVEAALVLEKQMNNSNLEEFYSQPSEKSDKLTEKELYENCAIDKSVEKRSNALTPADREIFSKFEENSYNLRASTRIVTSSSSNIPYPYPKRKYRLKCPRALLNTMENQEKPNNIISEKSSTKKRKCGFTYSRTKKRKKICKDKQKSEDVNVNEPQEDSLLNEAADETVTGKVEDDIVSNKCDIKTQINKLQSPKEKYIDQKPQLDDKEQSDFGGPLLITNQTTSIEENILCVQVNPDNVDEYVNNLNLGELGILSENNQSDIKHNDTLENSSSLVIIIEDLENNTTKSDYSENKGNPDIFLGSQGMATETCLPQSNSALDDSDICSNILTTNYSVNESCVCPPHCEDGIIEEKPFETLESESFSKSSFEINTNIESGFENFPDPCNQVICNSNGYEEHTNLDNDISNWPFVEEEVAEFDVNPEPPNKIPEEGRKFELKCSLPWKKIFNISKNKKKKYKTSKKGLELGPAKVEVRLIAPSAEWKVIGDYHENSTPVVKVKRLILQRGSDLSSSYSEKESEEEIENKKLYQYSDDIDHTDTNFPVAVANLLRQKHFTSDENLQPVVLLKRNPKLDELTLSMDQKPMSNKYSTSSSQASFGSQGDEESSRDSLSESEAPIGNEQCRPSKSIDSNMPVPSCSKDHGCYQMGKSKVQAYETYSPSGGNDSSNELTPYSPSDPHYSPKNNSQDIENPIICLDSTVTEQNVNNVDDNTSFDKINKIQEKFVVSTLERKDKVARNEEIELALAESKITEDFSSVPLDIEISQNGSFPATGSPLIPNNSPSIDDSNNSVLVCEETNSTLKDNAKFTKDIIPQPVSNVCSDTTTVEVFKESRSSDPVTERQHEQKRKSVRKMPKNFFVRRKSTKNKRVFDSSDERYRFLWEEDSKISENRVALPSQKSKAGTLEDGPRHNSASYSESSQSELHSGNSYLANSEVVNNVSNNSDNELSPECERLRLQSGNDLESTHHVGLNSSPLTEQFEERHRLRDGGRGLKRPSEGHSKEDTKRRRKQSRSFSPKCRKCDLHFKNKESLARHNTSQHATRELHHCLLCQRSFSSAVRHCLHVSGRSHRHLELTQRHTIHAMHSLLVGGDCPIVAPLTRSEQRALQWRPTQPGYKHFYHQPSPLQAALQELKYTISEEKPAND